MTKTFIIIFTLLTSLSAFSNTSVKGMKIAKKMEKENEGYKGESSKMTMVLIDARGSKIERVMEGKSSEGSGSDKSIITFLTPADIKGTKMLTHAFDNKNDDQWLFLPSSKRVKRIRSNKKSSSFMGSEFSYEDLGSQNPDKYQFNFIKTIKTKKAGNIDVVDRTSKEKSGYSKVRLYLSNLYNGPIKAEYFDRKKELLKVATMSKWKKFKVGKKVFYRPSKIHMKNKQTRKESIMTWENRKMGEKFSSRTFKQSSLSR